MSSNRTREGLHLLGLIDSLTRNRPELTAVDIAFQVIRIFGHHRPIRDRIRIVYKVWKVTK